MVSEEDLPTWDELWQWEIEAYKRKDPHLMAVMNPTWKANLERSIQAMKRNDRRTNAEFFADIERESEKMGQRIGLVIIAALIAAYVLIRSVW